MLQVINETAKTCAVTESRNWGFSFEQLCVATDNNLFSAWTGAVCSCRQALADLANGLHRCIHLDTVSSEDTWQLVHVGQSAGLHSSWVDRWVALIAQAGLQVNVLHMLQVARS